MILCAFVWPPLVPPYTKWSGVTRCLSPARRRQPDGIDLACRVETLFSPSCFVLCVARARPLSKRSCFMFLRSRRSTESAGFKFRPSLEALEGRLTPATQAFFANGVLAVVGDAAANVITVAAA